MSDPRAKGSKGCNLISDHSVDHFLIDQLVVWAIKCQFVVINVDCFCPKPKITSSNVLFCPQPKYIQFTVTEEHRNQKLFTFERLH